MTETVSQDTKEYTWQEVAKHNKEDDMWVIINDQVYDITKWVSKHPGGVEVLRLTAGRDITVAFDNYHPFTPKAAEVLPKYHIGVLSKGSYEFPPYKPDSGFYRDLRKEVDRYFKENNLDPKSPWPGIWRMILVTGIALMANYAAFGPLEFSFPLRMCFAIVFGICQALPLLHVMHDSSHMAFGHTQTWWCIAGRLYLDFYAGCSMTSWHNQHTIGHHIYTNIFKADPDMPKTETGDVRRLVPRQAWASICKWQHVYLPVLYGLLGVSMRVSDVTDVFTAHVNGPVRVNPHGVSGHAEHIASKIFCAFWRLYVPLVYWHLPLATLVPLTIVAELITGYWLAFNFQVSHISDVAQFPLDRKDESTIPMEWAVAQVVSSVDYSHDSPWTTFCCGALNYQIEHHLLPTVSQYHYPAIAPIVRRLCGQYGIKYNYLPNFYVAFYHHLKYLYNLGQKGQMVPLETSLH